MKKTTVIARVEGEKSVTLYRLPDERMKYQIVVSGLDNGSVFENNVELAILLFHVAVSYLCLFEDSMPRNISLLMVDRKGKEIRKTIDFIGCREELEKMKPCLFELKDSRPQSPRFLRFSPVRVQTKEIMIPPPPPPLEEYPPLPLIPERAETSSSRDIDLGIVNIPAPIDIDSEDIPEMVDIGEEIKDEVTYTIKKGSVNRLINFFKKRIRNHQKEEEEG